MTEFDIEDVSFMYAPSNLSSSDSSFDLELIHQQQVEKDFENSLDLFGDYQETIDPSTIAPLTYIPEIVPEFDALSVAISNVVKTVPKEIRLDFSENIVKSLTIDMKRHYLKEMSKNIKKEIKIRERK